QTDPSYKIELKDLIERQNEIVTGSVTHYIEQLKAYKNYQPEDESINYIDPKQVCENIGSKLKSIVDFKEFPTELKQVFNDNAWLRSHKFWDGTNLFSVIKSIDGKLSKKVNKALTH
ncbi:MAG: hypothetical protein PVH22_04835, partial [Desulfobacteraceae bacterium]